MPWVPTDNSGQSDEATLGAYVRCKDDESELQLSIEAIDKILVERSRARAVWNYALADQLLQEVRRYGVLVHDDLKLWRADGKLISRNGTGLDSSGGGTDGEGEGEGGGGSGDRVGTRAGAGARVGYAGSTSGGVQSVDQGGESGGDSGKDRSGPNRGLIATPSSQSATIQALELAGQYGRRSFLLNSKFHALRVESRRSLYSEMQNPLLENIPGYSRSK